MIGPEFYNPIMVWVTNVADEGQLKFVAKLFRTIRDLGSITGS